MPKLLFFDIDGTLFDDRRRLPPSVLPAFRQARENGCLLFLNTGRTLTAIFVHYNKCKNEGMLPVDTGDKDYMSNRRKYLISLDRAVPRDRQPDHCIQCGQCQPHCPQSIRIPRELAKIDKFIENLKVSPRGIPQGK